MTQIYSSLACLCVLNCAQIYLRVSFDAGQEVVYDQERDSRHCRRLRHRQPVPGDAVFRQVLSCRQRTVAGLRTQHDGGRLREEVRVVRDVQHGPVLQRLLLVPRHLHPPRSVLDPHRTQRAARPYHAPGAATTTSTARTEPQVGVSTSGGEKHDDDDVGRRRRRVPAGRAADGASTHRYDRRQHLAAGTDQRRGVVDGASAAESLHPAELSAQLLHLLCNESSVS